MVSNYASITAFVGVVAVSFLSMVGDVEGRFFPVVSQVTLTDATAKPPPAYRTTFAGTAEKYRDCAWHSTEWYLGPRRGRKVKVQMVHEDPPVIRGPGILEWQEIVIWLEEDEVRSNSHADVLHKCPGRPWLTRTPFYDGGSS